MTERRFAPRLPLLAERVPWQQAAQAAIDFRGRAAGDDRISDGFRESLRMPAVALAEALPALPARILAHG